MSQLRQRFGVEVRVLGKLCPSQDFDVTVLRRQGPYAVAIHHDLMFVIDTRRRPEGVPEPQVQEDWVVNAHTHGLEDVLLCDPVYRIKPQDEPVQLRQFTDDYAQD